MEVYTSSTQHGTRDSNGLNQSADTDMMEMDLDVDLGPEAIEVDAAAYTALDSISPIDDPMTAASTAPVVDEGDVVTGKIHIRGLDDLTSDDIKLLCAEHTSCPVQRLEWINDTAANVIYGNATDAFKALEALALRPEVPYAATQLRPAKAPSSRPHVSLQVRLAVSSDRKQARAHETSRFYLLHPEYDPRENGASRRRHPSHHGNSQLQRRRYDEEENVRRQKKDKRLGLDASMYDEDTSTDLAGGSSPIRVPQKSIDSYRPGRNRSASPRNQSNTFSTQRSRSPLDDNVSRRRGRPAGNGQKELLPLKTVRKTGDNKLFSEDLFQLKAKRDTELFPNKTAVSNHRRTDAIDSASEAADLLATKMMSPLTDGASDAKSLADRMTLPSQSKSSTPGSLGNIENFAIKGRSSSGLAIRGGATPKELFPERANLGKELFAEKVRGRGLTRVKAEDMFY